MPSLDAYALFCLAAVGLLLVPGPAVTYIVARSIHEGRRVGILSVLGVATGSVVHVLAAAVGLSAVVASSATAFTTLRFVGAAYLIFLGVRTWIRRDASGASFPGGTGSSTRAFGQGVIVNVLNPKTALFFLAFLPQFVDPSRGFITFQTLVLGLTFIALGVVTDGTYALLASRLGTWMKRRPRFARNQRLVTGSVLVALGVSAAVSGSRRTP